MSARWMGYVECNACRRHNTSYCDTRYASVSCCALQWRPAISFWREGYHWNEISQKVQLSWSRETDERQSVDDEIFSIVSMKYEKKTGKTAIDVKGSSCGPTLDHVDELSAGLRYMERWWPVAPMKKNESMELQLPKVAGSRKAVTLV